MTQSERIAELRARLEVLTDGRRHRIAAETRPGLVRPGPEELDRRSRELAAYVLELEAILGELLDALTDSTPAG